MSIFFCGRRSPSPSDTSLSAAEERVNIQQVLTEEEKASKQLEKNIFDAIERKDIAKVRELIEQHQIDVSKLRSVGKRSVLHSLAETKFERVEKTELKEIFQMFIEKRKCSVNDGDANGNTPVKLAAEIGNIPVLELLVEHKADVDMRDKLTGDSPLHWASKQGMLEAVHILIKSGATVTIQNTSQKTPLHLAVEARNKSIVLLLLYNKANRGIMDKKGETPLDYAEKINSPEIVALLREPHEKFENIHKLLEYAKSHDCTDIVSIFVKPEKTDGHGEHVIADSEPTAVTKNITFNITLNDKAKAAIGDGAVLIDNKGTQDTKLSLTSKDSGPAPSAPPEPSDADCFPETFFSNNGTQDTKLQPTSKDVGPAPSAPLEPSDTDSASSSEL